MYHIRRQFLLLFGSFFLSCLACNSLAAQPAAELASLTQMEDSLLVTADSMYAAFLPDTRIIYSERFARQLVKALKTPNSWNYGFSKLAARINILLPDDKAFRMFNWQIAPTEDTRRYYGAIQMPGQTLKLYGLVDYSPQIGKGAEDSIFTGGRWLGCLYYRIREAEVDGRKVYTLFGLNAASRLSNKKILEPLTFTESGPQFGAPIFNVRSVERPEERVNRFILEYKKDVQVAMNWDAERGNIYFDHLVSQMNDPARKYTYVPSGQIDGFKWNGTHWNYMQDIVSIVPRKDGEAPIGEEK